MKLGQGSDASSAKEKSAIGTSTLITGATGTTLWDHENDGDGMSLKVIAVENTVNVRHNSGSEISDDRVHLPYNAA